MSVLGAVVRLRPEHLDLVVPRLATMPGVDVALNPGDGRLVLVLEDAQVEGVAHDPAAALAAIAQWPEVLNTSLVYEHSDAASPEGDVQDYRAWRGSLTDGADRQKS